MGAWARGMGRRFALFARLAVLAGQGTAKDAKGAKIWRCVITFCSGLEFAAIRKYVIQNIIIFLRTPM